MARYSIQGLFWIDDTLEDAQVTVEGDPLRIYLNNATFQALWNHEGSLKRLKDALREFRGTTTVPRSAIEPEAASDLRLGLSLVDPEPSEVCIYPPCGLAAETVHRDGFPLCHEHAALMAEWDDLALV